MLAAIGDLVDDIVVRLGGPIQLAADTDASITRRRGGSAANTAVAAAHGAGRSRLLACVGTDLAGDGLLAEITAQGVDTTKVERHGSTGSIVVLVDHTGERTMLTDPGASRQLASPRHDWLDAVTTLHVPYYSLAGGAIRATALTLIQWAHARSISISFDLSSTSLIESIGATAIVDELTQLAPAVVFANADEAAALGIDSSIAGAVTVVKRGAGPASIYLPSGDTITVPAIALDGGHDSTGAGDAFAGGLLTFPAWRDDPAGACRAGHAAAARLLVSRHR